MTDQPSRNYYKLKRLAQRSRYASLPRHLPLRLGTQVPRSILIVEDEALIALDLEEALTAANFTICGIAKTIAEAQTLIASGEINAALLDAFLHGESSAPIAVALKAAKIPFIVVSGYESRQLDWVGSAQFVSKPYNYEQVFLILNEMCA